MCCNPDCANCGTTPLATERREKRKQAVDELLAQAKERRSERNLPDLDAIFKPVGHDGPHGDLLNPDVHGGA